MKPRLVLLGEAFGENEARIGRPFVGASGIELIRMLAEAQVISLTSADHEYISKFWSSGNPELLECVWNLHPEIYRTNVFNIRPPGNQVEWFCGGKAEGISGYPALVKSKYVRTQFIPELERLADELISVDPNLIVCLGNTPLWALTGGTGISKLRGATCLSSRLVDGYKLLPTYHPAAVLRQWELRPITVMDLAKAGREAEYPEIRRLRREIWIEPTLKDLDFFYESHIVDTRILSVDIENPGGPISCVGLAPTPLIALVVPFTRHGRSYWKTASEEVAAVRFLKRVLEDASIPKLFQNGLYDCGVLYRYWGIKVRGFEHDTMLCHHALQPESEKGLAFLGSIYATDVGAWKAEHKAGTLKRDE